MAAAAEARTTQEAVEILSLPPSAARVSQRVIELLTTSVAVSALEARVSQAVVELLGSVTAAAGETAQPFVILPV